MFVADIPNEFFNSLFFDLSDPRIYNSNDNINKNNGHSGLEIVRIRHFFDFKSTGVADHTEEITFYNLSEETNTLYYYEPEFKHYLNIYDFNGQQLQFHGIFNDYFSYNNDITGENGDSVLPDNTNIDDDAAFEILIDFPKERPLLKNMFRTITLRDKVAYPLEKPEFSTKVDVPFDRAEHTYVYIKKIQGYKADILKAFVPNDNNKDYFELEEAEEKEYLGHFETPSYYCVYSFQPVKGCNLVTFIEYTLKGKDWAWFYSGLVLGIFAFSINLWILFNHLQGSLTQIVPISTIVITYLVVMKGWVFMKDIDDVVTITSYKLPFRIPISVIYLILILMIFGELIISLFFGFFQQPPYQNLTIYFETILQNINIIKS